MDAVFEVLSVLVSVKLDGFKPENSSKHYSTRAPFPELS